MRRSRFVGLALTVSVLVGCSSVSAPNIEPAYQLAEYFESICAQLQYRDEISWLRNFIEYKNNRPFVISVICDSEGNGAVALEMKLNALMKSSGNSLISASASPKIEIGVSGESSRGAEHLIKVSLHLLDPGKYPKLYSDVQKEFDKYEISDIATTVDTKDWDNYAKTQPDWYPAIFFDGTGKNYSVSSKTKDKFYQMIKNFHSMSLPEKTKEAPPKAGS
jgi:hypothetical protein